jgi:uncharacterized protein
MVAFLFNSWMRRISAAITMSVSLVVCPGFGLDTSDVDAAQRAIDGKDYQSALTMLRPLAASNNGRAACLLGEIYEFGYGVPQDFTEALKWYKLAARSENVQPYTLHVRKFGPLPQDRAQRDKFVENLKKDAMDGVSEAQRVLGTLYFSGSGVKKDFARSFAWFEKSARQGNVEAINNLGFMYQHGVSVPRDYERARQLYKQAADFGNPDAQNNLGFIYCRGFGVPADYKKAAPLFAFASDHGSSEAASNLGWLYEKGFGVERDYARAVLLYAKAAAHGVVNARYNLGFMYQYGLGVERQPDKARKLYRLAAAMGYPSGENQLGFMNNFGSDVPGDYKQALKYYRKETERKAESYKEAPNFDIYD